VVELWIVRSAAGGASESCVELRFRERNDARRANAAHADADRPIHAGVPGDPRRQKVGRYEVIETLADRMLYRGIPENIRSDNGPEFVAEEVRKWLAKVSIYTQRSRPC
jgi:hypothetical protein